MANSNMNDMVGICGLEPQTSSLSVTRSNQLSYIPRPNILYILLPAPAKIKHKPGVFWYNKPMGWSFSFGWMFAGLLVMVAGALIVIYYQKVAENFLNGVSDYEKTKLIGIITVIVGLILLTNLHTVLLTAFVNLLFKQ